MCFHDSNKEIYILQKIMKYRMQRFIELFNSYVDWKIPQQIFVHESRTDTSDNIIIDTH